MVTRSEMFNLVTGKGCLLTIVVGFSPWDGRAEHLLMCLRDVCISPRNDRKVFLSLYHEPGLLVTRPMTGNKTERRSVFIKLALPGGR